MSDAIENAEHEFAEDAMAYAGVSQFDSLRFAAATSALILAHLAAHQPAPAQPAATGDEFFEAVLNILLEWGDKDTVETDCVGLMEDVRVAFEEERNRRARG